MAKARTLEQIQIYVGKDSASNRLRVSARITDDEDQLDVGKDIEPQLGAQAQAALEQFVVLILGRLNANRPAGTEFTRPTGDTR